MIFSKKLVKKINFLVKNILFVVKIACSEIALDFVKSFTKLMLYSIFNPFVL